MTNRKTSVQEYVPFILLGGLTFAMHMMMKSGFGDDIFFSQINENIFEYLRNRYMTWSSRLFVEALTVLLLKLDFFIWSIINSVIYTAVGLIISKLLVKNNAKEMNWLIAGLLINYPFDHAGIAGWVTTCSNYLYPLCCFLFCILVIKKSYENEKTAWFEYIFFCVALLYASSMEQTALLMTMFLSAYSWHNKKINAITGISLFICTAGIIIIVLSPGNTERMVAETAKWFPEFADFSIMNKFQLGFNTTVMQLFFNLDFVFFIFSSVLLLAAAVFKKRKTLCVLPVILILANLICMLINLPFFSKKHEALKNIISIAYVESDPEKLFGLSLFLLVVCGIILLVTTSAVPKERLKLLLFVAASGLSSKMMLGFSPTVYASGQRTSIFLYFSMIICIIIMQEFQLEKIRNKKALVVAFGAICLLSYIKNLIQIYYFI